MDYLRKALPGSEALRRAEVLLEQLHSQASMDETDGITFSHFLQIFLMLYSFNFILSLIISFFFSCFPRKQFFLPGGGRGGGNRGTGGLPVL